MVKKYNFYIILLLISLNLLCSESLKMETKPIGLRYLDFLKVFAIPNQDNFSKEIESLFSPDIKKVVNSNLVCKDRNQLLEQMNDVKKTYGLGYMELLELFIDKNTNSNILSWEIKYKDNTVETVITILKYNELDLITEINEVFGEKEVYKFPEVKNHLIEVAQNYLKFVNDVGSAKSVKSDDTRVKTLFAENLTKIDNRTILFANDRNLLLSQMKGFEKEYTPNSNVADWTVNLNTALIIPSTETNSVTVQFEWQHINVGRATTTAILQCNSNNQIEKVIDVWAKIHSV
ncbi:MAG: hypothetical protein P4L22_01590 [Candidatus Babeliales bacterium]|nr:hypothetical protein [Candidatus Babeliales bacterium]